MPILVVRNLPLVPAALRGTCPRVPADRVSFSRPARRTLWGPSGHPRLGPAIPVREPARNRAPLVASRTPRSSYSSRR